MLKNFSHVEMYVSNIDQSTLFYEQVFGFSCIAKSEIVSKNQEMTNAYIKQKNLDFILTSPLTEKNKIASHIQKHGDTIRNLSFTVNDVNSFFEKALKAGAQAMTYPEIIETKSGKVRLAKIAILDSIEHTLLEPITTHDYFLSKIMNSKVCNATLCKNPLFNKLDHVAICVASGTLSHLAELYTHAFGLKESYEENIDTGKSGMNSKVLESKNGAVKLVFTEPMEKYQGSQIKEFLKYHNGPGVQHLAFQTNDIIRAVIHLKKMGTPFLTVPEKYYEMRQSELPELRDEIKILKNLNILVDKDCDGYLYQIFTKPMSTRPTLFFEIIQREGSKGFGSNNIKTLFKLIELEQGKYGRL